MTEIASWEIRRLEKEIENLKAELKVKKIRERNRINFLMQKNKEFSDMIKTIMRLWYDDDDGEDGKIQLLVENRKKFYEDVSRDFKNIKGKLVA